MSRPKPAKPAKPALPAFKPSPLAEAMEARLALQNEIRRREVLLEVQALQAELAAMPPIPGED